MDAFNVKGPDGITRSLSEHYDGQKDVEQDPYGAWLAIQNQAARIEALEARVAAADKLAELLNLRDRYHVNWHKVDAALAAYQNVKKNKHEP